MAIFVRISGIGSRPSLGFQVLIQDDASFFCLINMLFCHDDEIQPLIMITLYLLVVLTLVSHVCVTLKLGVFLRSLNVTLL
ncbi:hypothetical protein HanXRQr2_Chr16g0741061 [Helianthus annuus]|uniref:Uncharacterized protein n=1 Tax=Helianthus annuus TaxID=4232 RepID=A0A9K3DS24_HELAN|nr:hypothetical protein HanXRQr2_Chr16g0741061 [Helianthus annuus]